MIAICCDDCGDGRIMDATEDGIIAFLKAQTRAHWDEAAQPYYLSRAASDLKEEGVSYKDILKEEKLKEFSKRSAGVNSFRFVEHPTQKAKVGLVPPDEAFEFEADAHEARSEPPAHGRPQGQLLLDFLHALSRLSAEELDAVVLPTRVLVKLAARK